MTEKTDEGFHDFTTQLSEIIALWWRIAAMLTVAEWMQTWGPHYLLPVDNKYGSDGSVWVIRVHWKKRNQLFAV